MSGEYRRSFTKIILKLTVLIVRLLFESESQLLDIVAHIESESFFEYLFEISCNGRSLFAAKALSNKNSFADGKTFNPRCRHSRKDLINCYCP